MQQSQGLAPAQDDPNYGYSPRDYSSATLLNANSGTTPFESTSSPFPSVSPSLHSASPLPSSPSNPSVLATFPEQHNRVETSSSVRPALASSIGDDDDEHSHSVYFRKDPSMDYQVDLHDDIISKHSIRQQRMGLDGIDNDNRYVPNPDYVG